jgi:hypothetical protein
MLRVPWTENVTSSLDREFYEFPGQRMLRVPWPENVTSSWTEKRTNLSVLEDVKPKRSIEATILRLKLRYFGHVMIAKRSLELDIMLGQVDGHRKQGKPQMRWLDSIKEATGLRLQDLREEVQDRKKMACAGGIKDTE